MNPNPDWNPNNPGHTGQNPPEVEWPPESDPEMVPVDPDEERYPESRTPNTPGQGGQNYPNDVPNTPGIIKDPDGTEDRKPNLNEEPIQDRSQ